MSALSLASLGVHCSARAVALATLGVICTVVTPQIQAPVTPVTPVTASIPSAQRQDHFKLKSPTLEAINYKQLYQEDEEVIALVVSMINTGLIE